MDSVDPLPGLIEATLRTLGVKDRPMLVLAVSGGRDSRVLLHAATRVWPSDALVLAHVHHGLQPEADRWLEFCQGLADRHGVAFEARRLGPADAAGVESWARRYRYLALADIARAHHASLILTGHHANDQLETVEMRRLRGAGPLGLAAMRVSAPVPGAPDLRLIRPFLGVAASRLAQYAKRHQLDWVEDPSNADPRFLRNRIRIRLDKAIEDDASTLARGLGAIDAMQREADTRLARARSDLEAARLRLFTPLEPGDGSVLEVDPVARSPGQPTVAKPSLSRAALARLPADRAAEVLRLWMASLGCRMPSRAKLEEIRRQLLIASSSECRIFHDGRWLIRYRDRIDSLDDWPVAVKSTWFVWDGEAELVIAGVRLGFHITRPGDGLGITDPGASTAAGWADAGVAQTLLRGRQLLLDRGQRSDQLRLGPFGTSRSWRNLVQERGIPTWLRPSLPVIRDEKGGLIYAAPFGSSQRPDEGAAAGGWSAQPADQGRVRVLWQPPDPLRSWI